VGIEARSRSRYKVCWNRRSGVGRLQGLDASVDAVDESLVRWPRFEPPTPWDRTRPHLLRKPGIEVSGRGEGLADQVRANQLPALGDQFPVRCFGKSI